MRPIRSFLLLLILLVVLTGLHYLIPVNRVFPSVRDFIPDELSHKLFSDGRSFEIQPAIAAHDTFAISVADTILLSEADSVRRVDIKRDPLTGFLDSLKNSKGQVRVMYYGDSQIEGDRITSYLRRSLRAGRGGTGPGLFLPLMPVMYTKSIWLRSSSNWKKYNYLSYRSGEITNCDLGPFMAICRYLPEGTRAPSRERAYIRVRPSNVADSSSSEYDYLRIFYGNTSGLVKVTVRSDDHVIITDTLKIGSGFNECCCYLGRAREITIVFEGMVSPDIYGISIESSKGIIVDNIPQRGSAGLEFTMVGKNNLEEAYRKIKPDLFILHYGLNIVRNVRTNYSYFQKGLTRQLKLLKEISPSTPILVLSLTDMAEVRGDSIISYRNIPAIIDAQRKAATNAGESFWDSYKSMGGESSIIRWAAKNPPLAQKDYVHFTYQGADTLSRILTDALFTDKVTDTVKHEKRIAVPDTLTSLLIPTATQRPAIRRR